MESCAECVESRTALAEEFKALGVLFSALGDENRQRVLATLLVSDQIGMRTGEIAERAICPGRRCPGICGFCGRRGPSACTGRAPGAITTPLQGSAGGASRR